MSYDSEKDNLWLTKTDKAHVPKEATLKSLKHHISSTVFMEILHFLIAECKAFNPLTCSIHEHVLPHYQASVREYYWQLSSLPCDMVLLCTF